MSSQEPLAQWHRILRRQRSFQRLRSSSDDLLCQEAHQALSPVSTTGPKACFKVELVREELVCKSEHDPLKEYELLECLGKGSFGQVHRALHKRTGVHRAVKVLPKTVTLPEEFEWELRALAALDHPHIVQVIEYFDAEDNYYIVTELCTGPDLFSYVVENTDVGENRFLPEGDVSVILRQCLKGVLGCHAHGFVHRDLNAKNFMITGCDRSVKLIDFGLATRCCASDTPKEAEAEEEAEIVGTAHYMAPEMMLTGAWNTAVDIWSLGVLLFVLLTGVMLLPKEDDKKRNMLEREDGVLKRLRKCKGLEKRGTSAQARDLLEAMLRHKPEERISASKALAHPFIFLHCNEYLGPPLAFVADFDHATVQKLRLFSKQARLKRLALMAMTHLGSVQEQEEELVRAQHLFRSMDKDGDGEISMEELSQALVDHAVEVPEDLSEIFAVCDSNSSGRLNFVEFVASMLPRKFINEVLCSEVFNILDRDSNGIIDAHDLQLIHPQSNVDTCEEMIREVDVAGKGHLDFDDFHSFMMRGPQVDCLQGRKRRAEGEEPGGGDLQEPLPARARLAT